MIEDIRKMEQEMIQAAADEEAAEIRAKRTGGHIPFTRKNQIYFSDDEDDEDEYEMPLTRTVT